MKIRWGTSGLPRVTAPAKSCSHARHTLSDEEQMCGVRQVQGAALVESHQRRIQWLGRPRKHFSNTRDDIDRRYDAVTRLPLVTYDRWSRDLLTLGVHLPFKLPYGNSPQRHRGTGAKPAAPEYSDTCAQITSAVSVCSTTCQNVPQTRTRLAFDGVTYPWRGESLRTHSWMERWNKQENKTALSRFWEANQPGWIHRCTIPNTVSALTQRVSWRYAWSHTRK